MTILKKTGQFFGDVLKMGIQPFTTSAGSLLGKKIDLGYDTKLGQTIGGKLVAGGGNVVHVAAKSYANAITGGLASKVTNLIRTGENKEGPGNYSELRNAGSKPEAALSGLGGVGGSLYGGLIQQPIKNTAVTQDSKNTLIQAAGSVMGSLFSGLLNKPQLPSASAQQAAFLPGASSPNMNAGSTLAQGSLFGFPAASSLQAAAPGTTGAPSTVGWFDNNKSWLVPVGIILGIIASVVAIGKLIFGRKRR